MQVGAVGAASLGRALEINSTLRELDLAWNHVLGQGGVTLARGIAVVSEGGGAAATARALRFAVALHRA